MRYLYTIEYYPAIKIMNSCYFWQHEWNTGLYAKWQRKSDKDNYHMILLICEILKKKKKHVDRENRSMAARGSRRRGKW